MGIVQIGILRVPFIVKQDFSCHKYSLGTIKMQFKGVLCLALVACTTFVLADNSRWSLGKFQPLSKDHCTTD